MVLLKNNVDWISDGGTYDRKEKKMLGRRTVRLRRCGTADTMA